MCVHVVDGVFGALTMALCVHLWLGSETLLLGVCIIFSKCVSYNPNRDSVHNDNVLKGTLVS